MKKFYVYLYLTFDGEPFYVGKGFGDRYKINRHNLKLQKFLANKINKIGIDKIKIHFLNENLSEQESFFWEQYWIKYIGRRDKNEGTLCNLTDGGDGPCGVIQSALTKEKRAISKLGKNYWNGKKHSEESRRKMSLSRRGNKNALGSVRSEEVKAKMSLVQKNIKYWQGKKRSLETIEKISIAHKGKKHSLETIEKIRQAKLKQLTKCKVECE